MGGITTRSHASTLEMSMDKGKAEGGSLTARSPATVRSSIDSKQAHGEDSGMRWSGGREERAHGTCLCSCQSMICLSASSSSLLLLFRGRGRLSMLGQANEDSWQTSNACARAPAKQDISGKKMCIAGIKTCKYEDNIARPQGLHNAHASNEFKQAMQAI